MEKIKELIDNGQAILGIEFGSTRIKAVLIDDNNHPIAAGSYEWENQLVDGIWTYSLENIWKGLQECYKDMVKAVEAQYKTQIKRLKAIGFSGMMHGYMAFDAFGKQLVPFRTWRNTITKEACVELSSILNFNVPQRWSMAHIYQAILNQEPHVYNISYLTTLAGYIHWRLTGNKVMGVGEASGMFPIDSETKDYDERMVALFDEKLKEKGMPYTLREIFPKVLVAGEAAGKLTEEGARLLDPTGMLEAGVRLCPPEGDAGTGMVATNSVAVRTGNVSAGTSVFAMVVLEEKLKKLHEELDMVTTPAGDAVAMVHCNNCTSDLNAWVNLFREFAECFGMSIDANDLYTKLFCKALDGDKDCGGLMAYNYYSGEPIMGFDEGRPLFLRKPDACFNLSNFMRAHLYSSLGALKVGLDILLKEEGVQIDCIYGHGGLFKTKGVGQSILAAAINAPVAVMETAGEGGAWGIALLASYMVNKKPEQTLANYLDNSVFAGYTGEVMQPQIEDVKGFEEYMAGYKCAIVSEKAAIEGF